MELRVFCKCSLKKLQIYFSSPLTRLLLENILTKFLGSLDIIENLLICTFNVCFIFLIKYFVFNIIYIYLYLAFNIFGLKSLVIFLSLAFAFTLDTVKLPSPSGELDQP